MANQVQAVIGAILVALALIVGIAIVDSIATTTSQTTGGGLTSFEQYDAARLEDTSTFVDFNDGQGTNETVWKTTGFAINLTGASDSYVESNEKVTIAEDANWSLSTWAYIDQGAASTNMTAVSGNGRILIQYYDGNWSAWYYDDGSRSSWRVNVSAPDQPANYTLVTATSNGTHLTIYANTTQGEVQNITGSGVTDAELNSTNWDGRLEETRAFDDYTNASEQSTLHANPIAARDDRVRTLRAMYDQPGRDQILLFTDTALTYSNATFSPGFAAQEMQPESIVSGDYEWRKDGPAIRPLSGGDLEGFPVAYASYDFDTTLANQIEGLADAFGLASIIPLAIIAGAVLFLVGRFN